ncbi:2'-5' RNA ligase family protein (plasmid) [Saccharopolyspora sp. ID03-671]|uniref:2'-5' RNA ligase family protein n=1 Tax=Saccharopolyspora sp. ID03-671 TaxID=3073066 RepID=UPI0030F3DCD2
MAYVGQTGIVIPVSEGQPLLDAVAERFPDAVRTGVPAHLSLLYPFVPAAELDEHVVSTLTSIFAQHEPLSVKFAGIVRSDGFVALRPEPADRVEALASAVRSRWPDVVPYDGRYDAEPHLTVAMQTTEDRAGSIERELLPGWVPLSAELREAWLVEFDGQWQLRSRFILGAS